MTLAELIASEPLNAGRTDQQVLDWCNEFVNDWQDVSWLDLSMWITTNDLRGTIITRTKDADAAVATAAQHIVDCITAGQPLAMTDSRVRATLNKALPVGTVRDALVTLATKQIPRWEAAGVPRGEVTINHVAEARNA